MNTKGNSPSRLEFVWIRVHSWLNQRFLKKSIGGFPESVGALASPRSGARGTTRPVSGYFTGRCWRKHRERLEALPYECGRLRFVMQRVREEQPTWRFPASTCRRVVRAKGVYPFSRVVRAAVGREGLRSASRPGSQRVVTKGSPRILPRLSPPSPAATGDRSRSVRLRHRCVG